MNITSKSIVKVSPQNNTTYSVEVRDAKGCISVRAAVSVNVSDCTGLEVDSSTKLYSMYPNPAAEKLNILFPNDIKVKGLLLNALGEVLQSFDAEGTFHLDLTNLQQGIYFLKMEYNNISSLQKVIKE